MDDLCPFCGSAFEPVGALSELVGLRAITSRDRSGAPDASGTEQAFVARLCDHLDRRAREAHGDGTAPAEAVAVAVSRLPHPGT